MKRLLLLAAVACLGGILVIGAGSALSANGDQTCTGTEVATVPHDLIVPPGATCTLQPGSSVGHDVIVNKGATLIDNAATVGHDIRADRPAAIGIGGNGPGQPGSVGHDVRINGTTGATASNDNYVCNTTVGHDVSVEGSAGGAGQWFIGDSEAQCGGGGVQVTHDLTVKNNANHVDVSENGTNPAGAFGGLAGGVGHDLQVTGNLAGAPNGYVVEGNVVGHDATCAPAPNLSDGDFVANSAGHKNKGCG